MKVNIFHTKIVEKSGILMVFDKKDAKVQLVAKKTGTVRIKLTHFCNFP
jgi:hypothetical protein